MIKNSNVAILIIAFIFLNTCSVSAETKSNFDPNIQNSGGLLWKFQTGNAIYGDPVYSDGMVYITSTDKNLYVLDAMTGKEIWQFSTEREINTPKVSHGVVYVSSGDQIYALDAKIGNIIWQTAKKNGNFNSIPIVENGILYVTSEGNDYTLYALDSNNGNVIWQFSDKEKLESPSVSNGIVYFSCRDGNFYALDSMTGNKLWQFTNEGDILRSFSISNGIIYLTGAINKQNKSNIYAIDGKSGKKIWRVNIDIGAPWKPQITQDVLCICGMSNNVIGIDTKTGEKSWQFNIGVGVTAGPDESNGVIYFGSGGNNNFYAIDISSGKKIWEFTAGDYTPGFPIISDGIVYYHSADGYLYALNTQNGSKIWQYAVDMGVGSGLEVINGVVYCGSKDNNVYAIGRPGSQPSNSDILAQAALTSSTSESDELTSAFSVIQTAGNSPMEISFIDQSSGKPTTWLWNFGDGTIDGTQNPTHLYTTEGTYNISLTVGNGNENSIPMKKQVTIINTNSLASQIEKINKDIISLPDLTITSSSMYYNPDSSNISVNLTIENKGERNPGKFYITYFLTETKTNHPLMSVDTREYILGRDDVNGLEPAKIRDKSSTKTFSIDKIVIPSGTYWFGIVIDSRNEIGESDEENNVLYGPESIYL